MNKLDHLEDFKTLLANYQTSPASKKILASIRLVLLLAPTASGRNTIIRKLVSTGHYHFIVSDTTRHKRVNNGVLEQDGVEYWFRTEAAVLADLKAGRYVEAELIHGQQVSGINIAELEKAKREHRIAINEVDYGGIHAIVQAKPDTLALLVLPPSLKEWMRRVKGRGHMDQEEFKRRMQTAKIIFGLPQTRDYFKLIINDTIEHAVEQIEALARGEVESTTQQTAKELAKTLQKQTSELLEVL